VQSVVFPFTETVGFEATATAAEELAVQPLALVLVTVYVALDTGETEMEDEVAPVLHENDEPPVTLSSVEAPEQMVPAPAITGTGSGFTVTEIEVSSEQEALNTVSVYVAFPVGETEIEEAVAPVLHENDEPPDALSVAEAPAQMAVGPVITAVILPVTVTVAIAETVQAPVTTVTV
jgi:hypothetical protein